MSGSVDTRHTGKTHHRHAADQTRQTHKTEQTQQRQPDPAHDRQTHATRDAKNVTQPGRASTMSLTESHADSKAQKFVEEALRFKGQPYLWGGGHGGKMSGPGPVDCSGLVNQAAALAGIKGVNGTTSTFYGMSPKVDRQNLKPGDLVLFDTEGKGSHSHVGIYLGEGKFLHAPHTGDVVKISSLDDPYYASRFAGGRRIAEGDVKIDLSNLPTSGSGPGMPAVGSSGRLPTTGRTDPAFAAHPPTGGPNHVNTEGLSGTKYSAGPISGADPSFNRDQLYAVLGALGIDASWMKEMADKYGVPLEVVERMIWQESVKAAKAKAGPNASPEQIAKIAKEIGSSAGARGMFQLMPDTARGLGVGDVTDPKQNIEGGMKYLKQNLDMFNGDVLKAVAAYNAGPGNVQKYGGVPPFEETQGYVRNILGK
ncbi:MAG TPA: NlpC/P60 family protein [Stenomitos sp.]